MRRLILVVAVCLLSAAGCGDDDIATDDKPTTVVNLDGEFLESLCDGTDSLDDA